MEECAYRSTLFILCGEVPVGMGYTHTPSGRTTNQLTTTPHPLTYMATNKAEGKGYISVVVFFCLGSFGRKKKKINMIWILLRSLTRVLCHDKASAGHSTKELDSKILT